MKKHFFIPLVFGAFLAVCMTSCHKETQNPVTSNEAVADGQATDRTLSPYNPCGNRHSVWVFDLAGNGVILGNEFGPNWKSGELDRIANDCVLGNTIPGNCSAGGVMPFSNPPGFALSNFTDANGYVSVQQQDRIISMALAYAASHITTCGVGTSPTIYQIDFTLPQNIPVVEFAVRYSCCPSNPNGGE